MAAKVAKAGSEFAVAICDWELVSEQGSVCRGRLKNGGLGGRGGRVFTYCAGAGDFNKLDFTFLLAVVSVAACKKPKKTCLNYHAVK